MTIKISLIFAILLIAFALQSKAAPRAFQGDSQLKGPKSADLQTSASQVWGGGWGYPGAYGPYGGGFYDPWQFGYGGFGGYGGGYGFGYPGYGGGYGWW